MKVYARESLHFEWEEDHKFLVGLSWLPRFLRKLQKKTYIVHFLIYEEIDQDFLQAKVKCKYVESKKDPFKQRRIIDSIGCLGGNEIEVNTWGEHCTVKVKSKDDIEPWIDNFKKSEDLCS